MKEFSLALGLLDYGNPILYACFFVILAKNLYGNIKRLPFVLFVAGAVISLTGGFAIPTLKVLIGLKKMSFSMPVNFVLFVNIGFFISGTTLFISTFKEPFLNSKLASVIVPYSLFNSLAVLLGVAGIVLIYVSVIKIALSRKRILPVVFVAVSIAITLFLGSVGALMDVTNPMIHWLIEISNILCQLSLVTGAFLTFSKNAR